MPRTRSASPVNGRKLVVSPTGAGITHQVMGAIMRVALGTSPRAERISGPEKFPSSAEKDFFNTICHKQHRRCTSPTLARQWSPFSPEVRCGLDYWRLGVRAIFPASALRLLTSDPGAASIAAGQVGSGPLPLSAKKAPARQLRESNGATGPAPMGGVLAGPARAEEPPPAVPFGNVAKESRPPKARNHFVRAKPRGLEGE
jgi:hypothetical protein